MTRTGFRLMQKVIHISFAAANCERLSAGATALSWNFIMWRLKYSPDLALWPS
jgi:hypothetical protein